ncbi:MAG: phosphoglycolate phosphatase [Orrella sp.]|jgi:phosphoglycolate phosphatase|uniref:phosphoglycolate phosphatase n=1 Tax=Orrella sp. TaxID=1921583 RepID=UPI003BB9AC1A
MPQTLKKHVTSGWQAVLLDLDGTLLDTLPDLAGAANAMRQDLGLNTLPATEIGTYIGKGVDLLVARALAGNIEASTTGGEAFERARQIFYSHYETLNGQLATFYPGVLEGLHAIQTMGIPMGVVTNKPTQFALPLLERTGLAPFMQTVVCGDSCEQRKPDPAPVFLACRQLGCDPQLTLTIGDSVNDALAARAAGCKVLAVPYGYNEGNPVTALEVDGIVESIQEAAFWLLNNQPQLISN